jgi:protein-S-isoprenylcysteine O-methyltransferase Ste14
MFAFWQPLGGLLWRVVDPRLAWLLIGVSACGWLLVLLSTFMIDHFDLFGLRQVWNYLRGNERTTGTFRTPGAYRLIRHPLYAGFLIAFWATPAMTVAHTLFAVATTGYILVAIQLEERDLIANFGDTYRRYRTSVPMLLPFLRGPK